MPAMQRGCPEKRRATRTLAEALKGAAFACSAAAATGVFSSVMSAVNSRTASAAMARETTRPKLGGEWVDDEPSHSTSERSLGSDIPTSARCPSSIILPRDARVSSCESMILPETVSRQRRALLGADAARAAAGRGEQLARRLRARRRARVALARHARGRVRRRPLALPLLGVLCVVGGRRRSACASRPSTTRPRTGRTRASPSATRCRRASRRGERAISR